MSPERCQNIDEAWHSAVRTVLSQLRHPDITGLGWKWDCADEFQQQYYPLFAAWVGDYLEQVMIAQVSYGPRLRCQIPKCAPMWHSTVRPLNNSRDQHIYSELLGYNHIDALHTLCVHPIDNQFWQYPLCNVYWLWQPMNCISCSWV